MRFGVELEFGLRMLGYVQVRPKVDVVVEFEDP